MQWSEILAQSFTLPNGSKVPNRIIKAAMSEALGTKKGSPTPGLNLLYQRWSHGGTGLLITGNVMIDSRALGESGNVILEDETFLPEFAQWAKSGSEAGNGFWMQLNHPGKQAPKNLNRETVAPSAVPLSGKMAPFFAIPRELRPEEIEEIITRFGNAAAIAQKAGFTGVQIHGAHGYLVSQFLSPRHNLRQDEWGGTSEKRRRFVLGILREIRRRVGAQFPIGIKLNSADFKKGGFSEEESIETIASLAEAGIDLVEVSGGTYEAPAMTGVLKLRESTLKREAYFIEFTEKVRKNVRVPLMLTGGFRTLKGMGEAISSSAVDFVGLGRPLAVEPNLPLRLFKGQEPLHPVGPLKTRIQAVDRMGIIEIIWYTKQLKRMAQGKDPDPKQSPLCSLTTNLLSQGWKTLRPNRA